MSNWSTPPARLLCAAIVALAISAAGDDAFERSEERPRCQHFDPLRRPLFGDLHVHTRYSFDSFTSGQRNDPWGAYRYAKGEPLAMPDENGFPTVTTRLRRPLDFAAVTDHAELFGEIHTCSEEPYSLAYWTPMCIKTRSEYLILQLLGASSWTQVITQNEVPRDRSYICSLPGSECEQHAARIWENVQRAAEEHYDRSAECRFTTFVGYEYTDTPNYGNLHRNVIFRNDRVTRTAISAIEVGANNIPELWRRLRSECTERGDGCDVMAIPHNSNLARGLMFADPANDSEARDRLAFEPLVELIQHKAASECRFDRLAQAGVGTSDELCTFEQNDTDSLLALAFFQGELQEEDGGPVGLADFARRNMVRNALKDGLALQARGKINPFKMGFIGSTDTHNAIPGATVEDDYVGHLGRRDSGVRNIQDHFQDNPGGLAVVWAEENSRDAIFAAMRRRETYATSGTRPIVRFFAGWELAKDLCDASDFVQRGYDGVAMGGDLPPAPPGGRPRFLVSALKDAGTPNFPGTDLQRIQIVKGWVDDLGHAREEVFDVAGSANSEATVDRANCERRGSGAKQLCAVWQDEAFDPGTPAFYYARVLENPTCRWSTLQCMAAGVNPFAEDCDAQAARATNAAHQRGASGPIYHWCCQREEEEPFYSPIIQERAWTSPIWYQPGR